MSEPTPTPDTAAEAARRWSSHGHWIGEYQWTSEDEEQRPDLTNRCGGPGVCSVCKAEQKTLWAALAAERPDTAAPATLDEMIGAAADAIRLRCAADEFYDIAELAVRAALAGRSVAGTPTPAGTSAAADEFERFATAMREVLQKNPEYTHGSLAWRLMNALDSRVAELRTDARYLRPQAPGTAALTEDPELINVAQRMAAALSLAIHDAHPAYGNTTGWRGGIGGQAITQGCSFIDPPPGVEYTQHDLLSTPLREFLTAHPFDLNQVKAALREELEAQLHRPQAGDGDE